MVLIAKPFPPYIVTALAFLEAGNPDGCLHLLHLGTNTLLETQDFLTLDDIFERLLVTQVPLYISLGYLLMTTRAKEYLILRQPYLDKLRKTLCAAPNADLKAIEETLSNL